MWTTYSICLELAVLSNQLSRCRALSFCLLSNVGGCHCWNLQLWQLVSGIMALGFWQRYCVAITSIHSAVFDTVLGAMSCHVSIGVPVCLFVCVCVQVASVGLSEEEAKAKGLNYKTGKFSFMANSRARAVNDTEGMVSDKLCGNTTCHPSNP